MATVKDIFISELRQKETDKANGNSEGNVINIVPVQKNDNNTIHIVNQNRINFSQDQKCTKQDITVYGDLEEASIFAIGLMKRNNQRIIDAGMTPATMVTTKVIKTEE